MDSLNTFSNNFVGIQERLNSVSYASVDIVVPKIESPLANTLHAVRMCSIPQLSGCIGYISDSQ